MRHSLALLLLAAVPAGALAQDSTHAGRFDLGKMWTFENPPIEYFSSTYGFAADSAWFARARRSALRVPGCSAAFVSSTGLIVTNHHCVRGRVPSVARPGETLLDSGFVARTQADERRIPGYYADQLLAALDVTERVAAPNDEAQEAARQALGEELLARYRQPGDSLWVQFVPLYNGARMSAYVFRRYTDLRFVMAAELQAGFFGGDPDNFTYPRYAVDFAVLRAYGPDDKPLHTPDHFGWGGSTGVEAGDVVFVIGNPGQTARLTTMAQLETQRDLILPAQLAFRRSRMAAMDEYRRTHPVQAEAMDIRNLRFSLSNREKSIAGRLEALHDPTIMARRGDHERILRDSIAARPDLRGRYGGVLDAIARVNAEQRRHAADFRAYADLGDRLAGSGTLLRGVQAWRVTQAPAGGQAEFRERMGAVPVWPPELEAAYLGMALADIADAYGPDHAITRGVLQGNTPEAQARALLDATALNAAEAEKLPVDQLAADPVTRVAAAFMPTATRAMATLDSLQGVQDSLLAGLGHARYASFGTSVPPDGSGSPRIADGVVQGYSYNGTTAPPYTTFYGMYDRFSSFGPGTDWDLPYRWRTPPEGLDLGTPLNFVSTADTYGGNSGSPAVTKDLRLVGLNFDRNIDALVRDYLYLPERGRNVMVDARAIEAALVHVYGLERVVGEFGR